MFDKRTGSLAAFLLTIMPMHVYYSRELRFYSLSIFLTLVSLYAFTRALDRDTRAAWVAYGVATLLALYSHYYVLVVVAVEGAWLVWMVLTKRYPRGTLVRFLIAAGVAVLLFLPWIGYDMYYEKARNRSFLDTGFRFNLPSPAHLLGSLFVRGVRPSVYTPSAWFVGLAWVLIAVGGGLALWHRSLSDDFTVLLVTLLLAGMAAVLLLDYLASYFFASRQLVLYTPIAVLVVSASLLRLFRSACVWLTKSPSGRTAEVFVLALAVVFSVVTLWEPLSVVYTARKQDWRGAAKYLLQHVGADDVLVTNTTTHLGFYLPELASQTKGLGKDPSYLEEMAHSYSRVWIFGAEGLLRSRYPNVFKWIREQQPVEAPFGDHSLRIYVYSHQVGKQALQEDVSRPGPRAGQ
jgi:4-amino-4-deoxy-L-arabinose transferase-like glycosyltransferase